MAIIDEPVRGSFGDTAALALPGVDSLRRAARGQGPAPPIHHLTGIRPTEAGLGKAVFSMPVTRWLEDWAGIIHAGVYAFFADAPLGAALFTAMPPGRVATTTQLFLSYVRPATRRSRNFIGRAQLLHVGREIGISDVRVEDGEGRLLAYGSTRCVFTDVPFDPDRPLPPTPEPSGDPPDPYLRPVPDGLYGDAATLETVPPIDVMRRVIDGEIHGGPISEMFGWIPESVEPGRSVHRMRKTPWLSAGGPAMYGGALALACDFALGGAVYSTLEPGCVFATLDMEVRFLRPVYLDDQHLVVTGELRHPGRTIRVASAEITDSQGKRVAIATGSALVVPGGLRQLLGGRLPDEIVGD